MFYRFFRSLAVVLAVLVGAVILILGPVAEVSAQNGTPLQTATSLTRSYIAGLMANRNAPDGVGTAAFLSSASDLTIAGNTAYFIDAGKLRSANVATGQVQTLGLWQGGSPWNDGQYLYSAGTINSQLVVQRTSIATLAVSTFFTSPPTSSAYGDFENLTSDGTYLYATDSANGRIWQITLATATGAIIADFGGPAFRPAGPFGPALQQLGPIWTDGTYVYLSHLKNSVMRIQINSGAMSTVFQGAVNISGSSGVLFVALPSSIQEVSLSTGAVTTLLSVSAQGLWASGQTLYFTESNAVKSLNLTTGQVVPIAGNDPNTYTDGTGVNATFGNFPDPTGFSSYTGFVSPMLFADSRNIYIADNLYIREVNKTTGVVSTLAGGTSGTQDGVGATAQFQHLGGIWGDGQFLYVSDETTIRKVEISTGTVTTLAGYPGRLGTTDGTGSGTDFSALFDWPGPIWGDGMNLYILDAANIGYPEGSSYSLIRQLNLATQQVTRIPVALPAAFTVPGFGGLTGVGSKLYVGMYRYIFQIELPSYAQTTLVGPGPGYPMDGTGASAAFDAPQGMWSDGQDLYVVDGRQTVRRVNLATANLATIYAGADTLSTGIAGDGQSLYIFDGFSLWRLSPIQLSEPFGIAQGGSIASTTSGSGSLASGYASLTLGFGQDGPDGLVIYSYRNPSGIVVSETSVPGEAPIMQGRMYALINGPTDTGIAICNPNDLAATISFYLTDTNGNNVAQGTFTLAAHQKVASFLDQSPYMATGPFEGTFSFTSSEPVAVIALHGFTNERGDFLMSTLPVINLLAYPQTMPVTLAHYAIGGGWSTQVLLVNPVNQALSGNVEFLDTSGNITANLRYSIPSASAESITNPIPASGATATGSILITPDSGTYSPSAFDEFSFMPGAVTTTLAGVPTAQSLEYQSYVEVSGRGLAAGSINSGIAIANTSSHSATVTLELMNSAGQTLETQTMNLPPKGQVSKFATEIFSSFSSPSFNLPFVGTIHISSATPDFAPASVTGLRSRVNERGEFLVTTTTPFPDAVRTVSPQYFPQVVTGGGYTTEYILLGPGLNAATGAQSGWLTFYTPQGQIVGPLLQ